MPTEFFGTGKARISDMSDIQFVVRAIIADDGDGGLIRTEPDTSAGALDRRGDSGLRHPGTQSQPEDRFTSDFYSFGPARNSSGPISTIPRWLKPSNTGFRPRSTRSDTSGLLSTLSCCGRWGDFPSPSPTFCGNSSTWRPSSPSSKPGDSSRHRDRLCSFLPLGWSFGIGQDAPFMQLLIVAAGARWIERKQAVAGGALLALCAIKPHLFAFVPVVLLAQKRYKALAAMLGAGAALYLYLGRRARVRLAGEVLTSHHQRSDDRPAPAGRLGTVGAIPRTRLDDADRQPRRCQHRICRLPRQGVADVRRVADRRRRLRSPRFGSRCQPFPAPAVAGGLADGRGSSWRGAAHGGTPVVIASELAALVVLWIAVREQSG